ISCSSLKPKSMRVFLSLSAPASGGPRLPEVVVEATAVMQAANRELDRDGDGHAVGLAVGELEIDASTALEIDDRVGRGRVGALVQVVVRERGPEAVLELALRVEA